MTLLDVGCMTNQSHVAGLYVRDAEAAKRFFRWLLRSHDKRLRKIVTDELGSYGVARRELMPAVGRSRRRECSPPAAREPHENHRVGGGGQGRNRTIDTRIFSTAESAARRGEAEETKRVSAGPTEPPSPTEPRHDAAREHTKLKPGSQQFQP